MTLNNLCTVWIDRFKLHANIARFNRAPVKSGNHATQYTSGSKSNHINTDMRDNVAKKERQPNRMGRTYVHVVKGQTQLGVREEETVPALVLDDNCLMSKDVSKCLLGRVKEFASLANFKMALCNEGFVDIKIQYMGEFGVMMEFANEGSLKLFRDNVSVNSWFSQVKQASLDFVTEGRIAWVEIEGIPFKMWSGNTFKRIAAKWGELLDIDDQEETCFHSKRLCIHTKNNRSISEDFKIIFRGKAFCIRAKETPGWESGNGSDNDAEEVPETVFEDEGQVESMVERQTNLQRFGGEMSKM
ncbi:hypothetical protein CTI12_AA573320 [Artemisia annua]|uniref:Uncharacterized protein n=1 Tax=Artemisia annua TaxID=35608 RepID=A0A2U1KRF2_ARTAN|nr:hypothetical protein CTI12_AA573320 [Artemisia annua]